MIHIIKIISINLHNHFTELFTNDLVKQLTARRFGLNTRQTGEMVINDHQQSLSGYSTSVIERRKRGVLLKLIHLINSLQIKKKKFVHNLLVVKISYPIFFFFVRGYTNV